MPTKQRLAEIAVELIAFAVVVGLFHAGRIWWLTRRRTTRWHICLVKMEWPHVSLAPWRDPVQHTEVVWETSLPDEVAINHLPMIGSKWAHYIVETVYSERGR